MGATTGSRGRLNDRGAGWTLLAPSLVEAVLNGRQPAKLRLDESMKSFPVDWQTQLNALNERAAR